MSVALEIGGDDLVFSVAQDSLQWTFGGLLNLLLDLVVGSGLAETASQIDDGHIRGWDTESHTGKFAVQGWDNLADGFGSSGGSGNDVLGGATAITPQLARGTVDGFLGGGGSVYGGHQTFHDLEVVVDYFGQWGQAVGGAGGVGDYLKFKEIFLLKILF